MKNLLLTSVFPPTIGGSGRWFWELYRRLPRDKTVVIAGDHPEATNFDQTHGLNVHRLPLQFPDYGVCNLRGMNRYRSTARQVSRIAQTEGATAIHCGAILPDGWIGRQVAQKRGLPYLVYLHGEELCYTDSSRELNWMARRVVRDAELVIVNSRNTERIALEQWRLPAGKIRLLHPGVDCERFVPAARDQQIRERLGWGDRNVILTVGRLQKRKGQDVMIRALPAVRDRISDVLYAIVGDGRDREALHQLVEELGLTRHVRFHGELHDERLLQCYQQCDLFVLANRQLGGDLEGFGLVLLEAQACGKPVIAGTSGGTADTVDELRTGWLVPCEAPDVLAEEIVRLLCNDRLRIEMGRAAREWVVERFDWDRKSSRLLEIFCPNAQPVVATS